MTKFGITMIAIGILWVAFIIWGAGLPGSEVKLYESQKLVCKRWSETWGLGKYPFEKCWHLENLDNGN